MPYLTDARTAALHTLTRILRSLDEPILDRDGNPLSAAAIAQARLAALAILRLNPDDFPDSSDAHIPPAAAATSPVLATPPPPAPVPMPHLPSATEAASAPLPPPPSAPASSPSRSRFTCSGSPLHLDPLALLDSSSIPSILNPRRPFSTDPPDITSDFLRHAALANASPP